VAFAFARFPETLFLLRLQDVGVAVAAIPLVWAALHVVRSLGSYPGGWLADRFGPHVTMTVGWGAYAVVCAGMGRVSEPWIAVVWFLGFGGVSALTESPERLLVAGSTKARRGTRYGMYHAGIGLAALPGGLMFGALYAGVGGPAALLTSGALAVALVVGGLVYGRAGAS
jgi:MFS family permease